jgi:hypothetical protein
MAVSYAPNRVVHVAALEPGKQPLAVVHSHAPADRALPRRAHGRRKRNEDQHSIRALRLLGRNTPYV